MTKGCNKLPSLLNLLNKLNKVDPDFKTRMDEIIRNNGRGSSLLRLLELVPLVQVDFAPSLLNAFMEFYNPDPTPINNSYSFDVCGGQRMNVTLEDVLYLTHLPIVGRAIISNNNKDKEAFGRVFSMCEGDSKMSLVVLRDICLDRERTEDVRIKAVLLMIVTCLIIPDGNGHVCRSTYVKFIENLDEVDSYAWGAAMLSYLYQGMKQYKEKNKSIDGFTWLIIGFFFRHFKGLHVIFEINVEQGPQVPMLLPLINALTRIGANHHWKSHKLNLKLASLHEHLTTEEDERITWHPYTPDMLPPHLHDHIPYCTLVAPLFCYNYVEHHLPHHVARQFPVLDGIDFTGFISNLTTIRFKVNAGRYKINFEKHYEKEIEQWEARRLAQSYRPAEASPRLELEIPNYVASPHSEVARDASHILTLSESSADQVHSSDEAIYYPEGDSDAVTITKRVIELLEPGRFVNETVIDFYINSFFFRKLVNKNNPSCASDREEAQRVQNWTKDDIFEKDYILIPVNSSGHWSLIVICHPGEVSCWGGEEIKNEFSKVPCILHMNSMKGTHTDLKNHVKRIEEDDSIMKMKAAEEALEEKQKVKPSFELSGKLAAETNRVRGERLLVYMCHFVVQRTTRGSKT